MKIEQIELPHSTLVKHQVKKYGPQRLKDGSIIIAEVRHDDQCGNGHNSFGVTATLYELQYRRGEESIKLDGKTYYSYSGGCCHTEVAEAFPELAKAIAFHLFSTDGPLHYEANAFYWAGYTQYKDAKNLDNLKSTIAWGALESDTQDLADYMHSDARGFTWNEQTSVKLMALLQARLPALMEAFKSTVEGLGFKY